MSALEARSAHITSRGRRPQNEDRTLDVRFPDGRHLIAVADGMGGHRSGAVASAMAIEILRREVGMGRPLLDAVGIANAEIFREASRNPDCAGMGTTLVAVLRHGPTYEVANVGDSRAYRVDREGIRQLTHDHSFAAEAARSGALSAEDIARSPWRNAVTRSLGGQAVVDVDGFGPFEVSGAPHLVLLCTDGLYRVIPDGSIRELALAARDESAAVTDLARLAWNNQSDDNISAAVVEFGRLIGSASDARAMLRDPKDPCPPAIAPSAIPPMWDSPRAEPIQRPFAPFVSAPVPDAPRKRVRRRKWPRRRLRARIARAMRENTFFALVLSLGFCWLLLILLT